jgi:hypothetical protein
VGRAALRAAAAGVLGAVVVAGCSSQPAAPPATPPAPPAVTTAPAAPTYSPELCSAAAQFQTAADALVQLDATKAGTEGVKAALQDLADAGRNLATAAGTQFGPQVPQPAASGRRRTGRRSWPDSVPAPVLPVSVWSARRGVACVLIVFLLFRSPPVLHGLAGLWWVRWLPVALGVLLSLLADWLLFLWVFARLPREPVTWRSAGRAVGATVGLELIKQGMVVYLAFVTRSRPVPRSGRSSAS